MAAVVEIPQRASITNIIFSLLLVALCVLSYVLLLILFLDPGTYRLDSLIYVDTRLPITPAVAVGLVSALLAGATSAFTTRCVEQSLWLKLVPREVKQPLTVGESHRLAQWSTSPLERVKYVLTGKFWLLKLSGPLLLATAIVAPVLLAGISQTDIVDVNDTRTAHQVDVWDPYINVFNNVNRGGSSRDLNLEIALTGSFSNFSAPVANVCGDDDDDSVVCSVTARSAAIFAKCSSYTAGNDDGMGIPSCRDSSVMVSDFCSDIVPSLCANLTCGSPSTFANFIVSREASCGSSDSTSCGKTPGEWGAVFGVWVGGVEFNEADKYIINTVDCELQYGNITVTQVGSQPPVVDRNSFEKSEYLLSDYESAISNVRTFIWDVNAEDNPLSFTLRVVGTGWNDLYLNPTAYGLLGIDAVNNAESVARRLENAFDYVTLSAFARNPSASDIVQTKRLPTRVYVYNKLMLLILLVPLVATIAGSWGRWAVGSDEDVIGYNPLAIASRGPVYGLFPTSFITDSKYRKNCKDMKVKGYLDATGSGQPGVARAGLFVEQ
ncbi:hypothetical protein jhhlp_001610 [Lomentospora prolificans]|uniref:Uncharacterized protein n=1 Tax=Lomentospora prolificans TaxID=41688 RepID=A0A2N3NIQ3_9PEZI|nr:hypothetical protein jhhlp_001610 [Lomentospora prolificans]